MKFEEAPKDRVFVENPKTGRFEFRDASGNKIPSDAEKLAKAELEKGVLGDEPLGPALAKALDFMDLDEILLAYPDDIDVIVNECADLVQSGLVAAANPVIAKEGFAKAVHPFEMILPQTGDWADADRARVITAASEGGLIALMLESKMFTSEQRKVFFDMTKSARELADALQKKPVEALLPEEKGVLNFIEKVKSELSKFPEPIRKAVGEAFKTEEDEAEAAPKAAAKPPTKKDEGHGGEHH
jgi:hypothetical protein